MRQAMEIHMAVAVMSDREDSVWMTAIINEARRGWRRAQRRCGRSRRRNGYARPIAAAAVLGHLHSTLVRWRPWAWKFRVWRTRSGLFVFDFNRLVAHGAIVPRMSEKMKYGRPRPPRPTVGVTWAQARYARPGAASFDSVVAQDRGQNDGVERERSQSRCIAGRSVA